MDTNVQLPLRCPAVAAVVVAALLATAHQGSCQQPPQHQQVLEPQQQDLSVLPRVGTDLFSGMAARLLADPTVRAAAVAARGHDKAVRGELKSIMLPMRDGTK